MSQTTALHRMKIENRLKERRLASGLSQHELARRVGLTRQALYSIESNHYLPSTEVALRFAQIFGCAVEDLFCPQAEEPIVEAELIGHSGGSRGPIRTRMARVGRRLLAIPMHTLGDMMEMVLPADGLVLEPASERKFRTRTPRVSVQVLQDHRIIEEQIVMAGCDPAMYLAAEHFRRREGKERVLAWTMGSTNALKALIQGKVHIAGLHLVDNRTGQCNVGFLRQTVRSGRYTGIRFATWEQGFLVSRGNPRRIHTVTDLVRRGVRVANREEGAGARALLDALLEETGLSPAQITGYELTAASHLELGRWVSEGKVDVGIGVKAVAKVFGLDFVPLREEHYDLVMSTASLKSHPTLSRFLDGLTTRPFRKELEVLGGYDLREVGTALNW